MSDNTGMTALCLVCGAPWLFGLLAGIWLHRRWIAYGGLFLFPKFIRVRIVGEK